MPQALGSSIHNVMPLNPTKCDEFSHYKMILGSKPPQHHTSKLDNMREGVRLLQNGSWEVKCVDLTNYNVKVLQNLKLRDKKNTVPNC